MTASTLEAARSPVNTDRRLRVAAIVIACIGLGIALFALTLPRYGLAPAIALLVPISACASPDSRPLPTIVLIVPAAPPAAKIATASAASTDRYQKEFGGCASYDKSYPDKGQVRP